MSVQLEAPAAVAELTRKLEEAGFETWAVGGAVRDALRGQGKADWDLATRARPEEVRRLFRRTVPIGIDHGTVGVFGRDGVLYEVTTFRRDVLPMGRKAIVSFSETLEEDLARRDFTINAIAWHPLRREIRDPFAGRRDLEQGLLKAVGTPSERFREDYLRVLRGLRFAGALDLEVEAATWEGLEAAVDGIEGLSPERVRDELSKVVAGPRPSAALGLYRRAGVFPRIDPALDPEDPGESFALVDAVPSHRPLVRLSAFFLMALNGEGRRDPDPVLTRLRFSNAEVRRISTLVAAGVPPSSLADGGPVERRRWMAAIERPFLRDVIRLWVASCRIGGTSHELGSRRALGAVRGDLSGGIPLSPRELPVGGADLMAMGVPGGPVMGELLNALLEAAWARPRPPDRTTMLGWIRNGVVIPD